MKWIRIFISVVLINCWFLHKNRGVKMLKPINRHIVLIVIFSVFFVFISFKPAFSQNTNNHKLNKTFTNPYFDSLLKKRPLIDQDKNSSLIASSAMSSLGYSIMNQKPLVTDEWQFVIAPYIWFAGLSGNISTNGQEVEVDASFSDIFDQLNFAFQIHGEAMKNRLFFFIDWTYINLTINQNIESQTPLPIDASLDIGVKNNLVDFAGGYRLTSPNSPVYFDLYIGGRLWDVDIDQKIKFSNLPDQSMDQSKTWVDLIVGARLIAYLSDSFLLTLKSDIGGFNIGSSSKISWNIIGNIGWETGWHGLTPFVGWRTLYVDYDDGSGDDFFEYKIWMNGIQTGLGFRF